MKKTIILASQSRARRTIFTSLGIPFKAVPSLIDEKAIRQKNLTVRAKKLAHTKALTLFEKYPNEIIVACDTFTSCRGKVLEKPESYTEAIKMLKYLSGNDAKNYTGFCYIDKSKRINFLTCVISKYSFRKLYDHEIREYVKTYPVKEWAAAFALVMPYVTSFVSRVNGSYTGISYGLPTEILIPLLKKSGFEPNPKRGMVQ